MAWVKDGNLRGPKGEDVPQSMLNDKLDKVTTEAQRERAYVVMPDGGQTVHSVTNDGNMIASNSDAIVTGSAVLSYASERFAASWTDSSPAKEGLGCKASKIFGTELSTATYVPAMETNYAKTGTLPICGTSEHGDKDYAIMNRSATKSEIDAAFTSRVSSTVARNGMLPTGQAVASYVDGVVTALPAPINYSTAQLSCDASGFSANTFIVSVAPLRIVQYQASRALYCNISALSTSVSWTRTVGAGNGNVLPKNIYIDFSSQASQFAQFYGGSIGSTPWSFYNMAFVRMYSSEAMFKPSLSEQYGQKNVYWMGAANSSGTKMSINVSMMYETAQETTINGYVMLNGLASLTIY